MLNGSFSIAMSVYQRVNLHFPMVFLWFPIVFLWFSYGFPMVSHYQRPFVVWKKMASAAQRCATNLAAEVGEATIKQISGVARHWARHCFSCRCNCYNYW